MQDDTNQQTSLDKTIEKIVECLDEKKYEEAITVATPLLDGEDSPTARSLIGQAQIQLGNYEEAKTNFEILTKGSDAVRGDYFNLATASTMAGHFDEGKKAMDQALSMEENLAQKLVMAFYYLQALCDKKEYARAWEQLEFLKSFYCSTHITDLTHLSALTKGIPPSFESVIDVSKKILEDAGRERAIAWLDDFASKVDEDGKNYIEQFKKEFTTK